MKCWKLKKKSTRKHWSLHNLRYIVVYLPVVLRTLSHIFRIVLSTNDLNFCISLLNQITNFIDFSINLTKTASWMHSPCRLVRFPNPFATGTWKIHGSWGTWLHADRLFLSDLQICRGVFDSWQTLPDRPSVFVFVSECTADPFRQTCVCVCICGLCQADTH